MYFMDFVNSASLAPTCRYFLGGDNDFLKNYVIDRIVRETGREPSRISSVKEITPAGLFGREKVYILGSKSNPKTFKDFTVKLSKSKMGKTYKDAGFIEVSCSNLFPSQAGQFASALMKERGMAPGQARTIAKLARHDPLTIYNAISALSYLDRKLTNEELEDYCSGLTVPDTFKVIDYFLEGDYTEFLCHVRESRSNIHELLWALFGAITRLQKAQAEAAFAKTWYQKKMLTAAEKIAPFGIDRIAIYVNTLCTSYGESREVLIMKLQRLVFYLRGFTNQL